MVDHDRRYNDKDVGILEQHVEEHSRQLNSIIDTLEAMNKKLDPISQTYRTTATLGKWIMAILIFVSVIIGILVEWKNLFK